jgi:hypothetical protein
MNSIVVAILAKNKHATLPLYLKCLYAQTVARKNIHLYIRTNDNTDNTEEILTEFINLHKDEYASVYYDASPISEKLKEYSNHEWNAHRFKILGKIRQDSIQYAIDHNSHYFVADCDNFIMTTVLQDMFNVSEIGVVGPMLDSTSYYSNFHDEVDANGYFLKSENTHQIRWRTIKGLFDVKVIHCTYFINNKYLSSVCYDDNSNRYEYVIFSDALRKCGIKQFLDNHKNYGIVSFAETINELRNDLSWSTVTFYKNIFVIDDDKK